MKESLTQLSLLGEIKEIDGMEKTQEGVKEQLNEQPSQEKDTVAMLAEAMERMNDDQTTISSPNSAEPTAKQSIIIAGGNSSYYPFHPNSVEAFSWTKGSWVQLPGMIECREAASCFVYQNQIMMAGGASGSFTSTDSIELLKVDKEPFEWITFPAKLPAELFGHKTVVYYDKLIVIGGFDSTGATGCFSNVIYEVLLRPPYSTKVLCRMPQPVANHGAELVDDQIFILGGRKDWAAEDTVDNVCVYDLIKNECKQMPALPYGVWGMSTVLRGNKIIVIGGENKKDGELDKVLMYDIETGDSEMLPSMKYKRRTSSAVATADGMVVMGGGNNDESYMKSVEYFNFGSNCWQELLPMTVARNYACAFVTSININ